MKIYESKLAQVPQQIFWCFCLYALIAAILGIIFHLLNNTTSTWSTFLIVIGLCLGQSRRFQKMHYKINEGTLIQYDFSYRTILVEQIVSVRILKKMTWISFHSPYNIVIETMDREKHFMAPQENKLLAEFLKKENPHIQIIEE